MVVILNFALISTALDRYLCGFAGDISQLTQADAAHRAMERTVLNCQPAAFKHRDKVAYAPITASLIVIAVCIIKGTIAGNRHVGAAADREQARRLRLFIDIVRNLLAVHVQRQGLIAVNEQGILQNNIIKQSDRTAACRIGNRFRQGRITGFTNHRGVAIGRNTVSTVLVLHGDMPRLKRSERDLTVKGAAGDRTGLGLDRTGKSAAGNSRL